MSRPYFYRNIKVSQCKFHCDKAELFVSKIENFDQVQLRIFLFCFLGLQLSLRRLKEKLIKKNGGMEPSTSKKIFLMKSLRYSKCTDSIFFMVTGPNMRLKKYSPCCKGNYFEYKYQLSFVYVQCIIFLNHLYLVLLHYVNLVDLYIYLCFFPFFKNQTFAI